MNERAQKAWRAAWQTIDAAKGKRPMPCQFVMRWKHLFEKYEAGETKTALEEEQTMLPHLSECIYCQTEVESLQSLVDMCRRTGQTFEAKYVVYEYPLNFEKDDDGEYVETPWPEDLKGDDNG